MPAPRLAVLPAVALLLAVPARGDKPAPPAAPWYVDDGELFDRITEKVGELAKRKKCLPPARLKALLVLDRTCKVTPKRPGTERLDPEAVYERTLPGVFVVGSVVADGDGFADGRMATAWAVTADGVLVTNRHVFDEVEDGEHFGVLDHAGRAYPVTDLLAVNKAADIAVFRIPAIGLTPLPVADRPARVGSWVGVLGHPGDRYFTFTQGHVGRYTKVAPDDGPEERWMSVTADFAYGSSGSPVVDRTGAVVGMAAMTESIDYPDDAPAVRRRTRDNPKADGQKPADPPAAKGSPLQMVVKQATPVADIRAAIGAE